MNGQFRDVALADNNVHSSLSNALNKSFHLLLFSLSVVEKFLGVLQKNGSFSVTLLHLNGRVVDSNLCLLHLVYASQRRSEDDHAVDDNRVLNGASKYSLGADVVNGEFGGVLGH